MEQLSTWGDVTSENEQKVITDNIELHPLRIELLKTLSRIFNSDSIEYWLDQGTLLGAHRNGKIIARDSDIDLALANSEHFNNLPELLEDQLPSKYAWYKKPREGTNGFCVYLKDGGMCEGSFMGRKYSWESISCDIGSYQKENNHYVQEYPLFSVDTFLIPTDVLFPLGSIEFEGKSYPCPNKVKKYLEIEYGYIGENAVYDRDTDRYIPHIQQNL